MASLKDILSWFEKNDYPTEEQFRESWKSFWHKSERIDQSSVLGLPDALNSKASKEDLANATTNFKGYHTSLAALLAIHPQNENKKDFFAWVGTPYPGTVHKVFADKGAWTDTGEVPTQQEIDLAEYTKRVDLFNNATIPFIADGNGYWTGTVGQPATISTEFEQYRYMNLKHVLPGTLVVWDGFFANAPTSAICALIDSAGNFVKRLNFNGCSNIDYNTGHFEYTMPSNASQIGFFFDINNAAFPIANAKITIGITDESVIKDEVLPTATEIQKGITKLTAAIDDRNDIALSSKAMFDYNNMLFDSGVAPFPFIADGNGYWTGTVGQPVTISTQYPEYRYMNLKQVLPGTLIVWDGFFSTQPTSMLCAFVDNDGNFVKRLNFNECTNINYDTGHYEYIMPSNASQVGFVFNVNGGALFPIANTKITIGKSGKIRIEHINIDAIVEEIGGGSITTGRVLASQSDMFMRGNVSKKYAASTKKKCIIVAGQSNTDGRVPAAQFPSTYVDEGGATVNYLTGGQIPNTKYCKNNLNANFGTWSLGSNRWAYDAIVLSRLQHLLNDTVYEIKWSQGGTAISPNGGDGGGFWTPRFENIPSNKTKLLQNFEQSIRAAIANNPDSFDIKAFLWHQGESDWLAASAPQYYDSLCDVIDYVRGVVGNPILPFIFGTVPHASGQYSSIVEEAMKRVAAQDKYVFMVDMSNGTLLDAYHFDAASSEYLGTKMYEILRDSVL
ncbi:hypothetical protein D0T53_02385 [Dysgonomonas sp. 216]|uniref:sialate O-acetylesterase n=1 Tax=Dysgonomonas sp. 216 TaxID=2302934 RepID=UPI0013D1A518|nr:sialate O-acetylesterase [Dysgonomonas sp. 216]NDW17762.1 hypothetical protein [Dysgonomonas sp. 216]